MFKGDKSVEQLKKVDQKSKKETIHIDLKSYRKGIAKIHEGNKIGVIGLQGSGNDQFIKKNIW